MIRAKIPQVIGVMRRSISVGELRSPFRLQTFRAARGFRSASALNASETGMRARFEQVNGRLPKFLRRYTSGLFNAPVSHIVAFLILHEITAVVPLFALTGYFHYTNWLPPYISEWKWAAEGMDKFGRYARRKGWLSAAESEEINKVEKKGEWTSKRERIWNWTEGGTRMVAEFATAWAITKALLPLRLGLSLWATPWFATTGLTAFSRIRSSLGQASRKTTSSGARTGTKPSPAAGTNAIGGGVCSRNDRTISPGGRNVLGRSK